MANLVGSLISIGDLKTGLYQKWRPKLQICKQEHDFDFMIL